MRSAYHWKSSRRKKAKLQSAWRGEKEYESCERSVAESAPVERKNEDSAAAHGGAGCGVASLKFQRGKSWLFDGVGTARSFAVPGLRETDVHGALPRWCEGKRFCEADCGRRLPSGGGKDSRGQCSSRGDRTRMSAGRSLRRKVPADEKG